MKLANRLTVTVVGIVFSLLMFFPIIAQADLPRGSTAAERQQWNSTGEGIRFLSSSRLTIEIDGTDYHFYDSNPWDGTYNFEGVFSEQCDDSEVTFDDLGGSGSLSTTMEISFWYVESVDGTNECAEQEESFAINRVDPEGYRNIDAFIVDGENIFMPFYRHAWGCSVGGGGINDNNGPENDGVFSLYPSDATGYNSDHYVLFEDGEYHMSPGEGDGGAGVERRANGLWIDTSRDQLRNKRVCGGAQTVTSEDISIAPAGTAIPGFYQRRMPDLGDGSGGGGGDAEEEEEDSCEGRGGATGWLLCPVILAVDGALDFVDTQIQGLLSVDTEIFNDPDYNMRDAWSNIRNIAYLILIPIMLVMVISTALGFDFISAYTVKRALPRLVIASLFIALSYDICVLLIEIFNAIGRGVLGLFSAPFGAPGDMSLGFLFAPATGATGGALSFIFLSIPQSLGFIVGLLLFLWIYGSTLLLAIVIGFIVLLARQLFIIALVLVAPLAILAWIFPGNDKLWKTWWSLFSKLLIMFPLIMALIALGRVFAWIIRGGGGGEGLQLPLIRQVAMLTVYILPYIFIPLTFKFAGGVFATITGGLDNIRGGMSKRLGEKRAQKISRIPQGGALKGRNVVSRGIRTALQYGSQAHKAGLTGVFDPKAALKQRSLIAGFGTGLRRGAGRVQGAVFENNKAVLSEAEKDPAFDAIRHNDTLLTAGLAGRREEDIRSSLEADGQGGQELEQSVAAVMKAQEALGSNFEAAAIPAKVATGSGYSGANGHGELMQDILRGARGDRNMEGNLIAAAKSAASNARRPDMGNAGFTAHLDALDALRGGTDVGTVSANLQDASLGESGAGAILGGRSQSVENFLPALRRRADNALDHWAAAEQAGAPQHVIDQARRTYVQRTAQAEALIDVAGQAAPSASEAMADGLHNQEIDLRTLPPDVAATITSGMQGPIPMSGMVNLRQVMDSMGSSPELRGIYDQMRRNYGSQYAQQAATTAPGAGGPPPAPGAGPAPGPGAVPSDQRIKRNVQQVGVTPTGIRIYRFQYLWSDQVYVGVIAQELIETHPEAVYLSANGYYAVDYTALGINMITLEEWLNAPTSPDTVQI